MCWYEIWNTVDEYGYDCTARWSTSEQAIADMKNHAHWYDFPGTGRIYKVVAVVLSSGEVELRKSLIRNFQSKWDGKNYVIENVLM